MRLPQLKTCDGASAGLVFLSDATALKAMHKAGRRGGDSIAREGANMFVMHTTMSVTANVFRFLTRPA